MAGEGPTTSGANVRLAIRPLCARLLPLDFANTTSALQWMGAVDLKGLGHFAIIVPPSCLAAWPDSPGCEVLVMSSPCPRCGATKTESVRHGFIYNTAWKMGYHMRRCSDCNRWRFMPLGSRKLPHPNEMTMEQLQESFNRKVAAASGIPPANLPTPGENMAFSSSDESPSKGAGPSTTPIEKKVERYEAELPRACPKCESIQYHRSRRRWYERLLKRPKMARCSRCGHRFPYPG